MGVDVTAPDGRAWHVSRSIRWPHYRGGDLDWMDGFPDPGFVDFGESFLAGIVIAVVVAFVVAIVIVVLLPVVLLLVEAIFVVVASMVFRRSWVVRASTLGPPPEERVWRVRGPFGSRAAVREVADELRRGVHAEPAEWEPA